MLRTVSLAAMMAIGICASVPPLAYAESPMAETGTASLTLTITDIETIAGTIRLGLYQGEAGYDGDDGITGANITVNGEVATVSFEGLAPGAYGVKLYHDVNDSGEMDTNPFGLPTEPYAFSNNAKGRFGPAGWDKAAFTIAPGANTHTISLN